jgi:protein AroM
VTIGQTPRDDVMAHMRSVLAETIEIVETGALDGLSREVIEDACKSSQGALLVTRLRGGIEVRVREGFVTPKLQQCIKFLQERVDLIAILCTGDFPPIESDRPVLYPGVLLQNAVRGLGINRLGVLTPAQEQTPDQQKRWSAVVPGVVVMASSPYGSLEGVGVAARRLREAGVDAAVMDCIGYTREMKHEVRSILGRPVLAATSLLARIVTEMLA